jgi:hypothetical protein
VVSLVAFSALAILWGNLNGISDVAQNGLGIGALGALALVTGFETLASYWKRGEIFRSVRTITLQNGNSYKGETLSDGRADGIGTVTCKNGDTLTGRFIKNKWVGEGTLTFKNTGINRYRANGGRFEFTESNKTIENVTCCGIPLKQ